MAEHAESTFSTVALESFLSAHPRRAVYRRRELAPPRPSMKHTLAAGIFLAAYTAVYLAVGFAAVSVIQSFWLTITR